MKEYRCPKCKKLLFKIPVNNIIILNGNKSDFPSVVIEQKCNNCKKVSSFKI